MTASAAHPLDNAGWAALTSAHANFAESKGRARRYPLDVSPFAAVDEIDAESLEDLAALAGPDGEVALFRAAIGDLPAGWSEIRRGVGAQLSASASSLVRSPQVDEHELTLRPLGVDDVSQMLDLVARTVPGPFLPRTIEMGRYYGYVRDGRLVAMAGERLHLDGYTEISAVCTDPEVRGRGLAARLTSLVAEGIFERGETPFLHVASGNDVARRVYERIGFSLRSDVEFVLLTPADHR